MTGSNGQPNSSEVDIWPDDCDAAGFRCAKNAGWDCKNDKACELRKASCCDDTQSIERLLGQGLDIDAANAHVEEMGCVNGSTYYFYAGSVALRFAAGCGAAAATQLLVDRRADVDARSSVGMTALHSSAWYGKVATSTILISARANVAALDHARLAPRDIAALRCNQHLLELLPEPHWKERYRRAWDKDPGCILAMVLVPAISGIFFWLLHHVPDTMESDFFSESSDDDSDTPSGQDEGEFKRAAISPHRPPAFLDLTLLSSCVSRGALLASSQKIVPLPLRLLATGFRMAELFCNVVVPMRLMLELSVVPWACLLVVMFVLPNYVLTGSLVAKPKLAMMTSVRQSLFCIGDWTCTTVAFCIIGLVRMLLIMCLYACTASKIVLPDWSSPSRDWFRNCNGYEVADLLSKSCLNEMTIPPGITIRVPRIRELWYSLHVLGAILLIAWLVAVLSLVLAWNLMCQHRRTPQDIISLAKRIDEACDKADGKTYAHLHFEDGTQITPFRPVSFLPPGGIVLQLLMMSMDQFLDLNNVNTFILTCHMRCATVLLIISVVSNMHQISRCYSSKFLNEVRMMFRTGIRSDEWMKMLEAESVEQFLSLYAVSYAVLYSAKTPYQFYSGCFSILVALYGLSSVIHRGIDLVRVGHAEDSEVRVRAFEMHAMPGG